MIIGNIDTALRPLVIAEIGNNHEGNYDTACELIERAAECGVGGVKFQTFRTELYVDRREEARFKRMRQFELTPDEFARLSELAHSFGLLFISTPLDLSSAAALKTLVDAYKIASGDNDFFPLLECVGMTGRPMIISTGASDSKQVTAAIDCVQRSRALLGAKRERSANIALLHCVSCYPTPPEQANLKAIPTLISEFGLPVGYSDHTMGLDACVIATILGAVIIEKHFTLDHHFSDFRDHQLSAEPSEMKDLVRRIEETQRLLGNGVKTVQACEADIRSLIGRSMVVVEDRPTGHELSLQDIAWVRPAGGLPPGTERDVVGRRLRRNLRMGERIAFSDVE